MNVGFALTRSSMTDPVNDARSRDRSCQVCIAGAMQSRAALFMRIWGGKKVSRSVTLGSRGRDPIAASEDLAVLRQCRR